MSTVVEPPQTCPQPRQDELEALIEEARRRQRQRRRRIGAALLAAALGGGIAAYLVSTDGEARQQGTQTSARRVPPQAPAKAEIIFASDQLATANGEIFRVRLDGRKVDLSRSWANDVAPAVSPDGKEVAFLSDRGNHPALYAIGIDGRALHRLSPALLSGNFGNFPGSVAWSPDGERIAAAASADSSEVLYLGTRDGLGRVIERTFVDLGPTWSPDGRLLAYRTQREVRVVDNSGAPAWRVHLNPRWLSWSRAGNLIVLGSATERVYDKHGRLIRLLHRRSRALPVSVPTAPDHSLIASLRETAGKGAAASWALQVSRRDHSNSRTVVRSVPCARDWGSPFAGVQFTPSGRSLVYQTSCADPQWILYGVHPEGLHLHRLRQPVGSIGFPAFSPDGRSIAFTLKQQLSCGWCSAQVWVMDANGQHARAITYPRGQLGETDSTPTWSPDGRRILFSRSSSFREPALYVVSTDGPGHRAARALHVLGDPVAWRPGRIIYGVHGSFWTERPDGRDRRKLAVGGTPNSLAWSRDGRLAYVQLPKPYVFVVGERAIRLGFVPTRVAWSPDGRRLLVVGDGVSGDLFVVDLAARRARRLTSGMGAIYGASWARR